MKKTTTNPNSEVFSGLAAPAKRTLENNGITTLEELAAFSEKDIMKLHGMGKSALPKLRVALEEKGLSFKKL